MVGAITARYRVQLELPKCFYYLLHWVFDSEGCARLATPDEMDIQISIQQSADDQEIDIAQRCCQDSSHAGGSREPSWNLQNGIRTSTRQRKQNGAAYISTSNHTARRMGSMPKHLSP
jgi:hypothetical protein